MPTQDGTGGTFNFQFHPAFWFGMAPATISPLRTLAVAWRAPVPCTPDSDTNIFTSINPADPKHIGKHPARPSWSCSSTAVVGSTAHRIQLRPPAVVRRHIFSLSQNQNNGAVNNADCLSKVGVEPANYAFITRSGIPIDRTDPLGVTSTWIPAI